MTEPIVSTKIVTIPNLLTFLRMALIPVFAMLLVYQREGWALVVFTIAGVSDGVDGFVARHFKQESELGTIIDPIADKLLMTTAFIMLTLSSVVGTPRHLPVPFWVTATVIGRDIAIIAVAGAINVMTGFRGFKPSWLGKASTFVQVVGVPGKYLADLYMLARQRLLACGVEAIHGGEYCTFSEPARFFSHRRDSRSGRMAAVIWRE